MGSFCALRGGALHIDLVAHGSRILPHNYIKYSAIKLTNQVAGFNHTHFIVLWLVIPFSSHIKFFIPAATHQLTSYHLHFIFVMPV